MRKINKPSMVIKVVLMTHNVVLKKSKTEF
jgi:hypothetical protein